MLSDERIAEMMRETRGAANIAPRHAETFARAIEAEVRKQDEALILQLVEALERARTLILGDRKQLTHDDVSAMFDALTAGRAWLEGKP